MTNIEKHTGNSLQYKNDEEKTRDLRLILRSRFEKDEFIYNLLVQAESAIDCFDQINERCAPLAGEHGDFGALVAVVIKELLVELDELKKKEPSLYLVDTDTGKLAAPIDQDSVYQPPPFVDEGGNVRMPPKIVHPKISAPIILGKFESGRLEEAIQKAGPENASAYEHLTDQESIKRWASKALAKEGVTFGVRDGNVVKIEFGKEEASGFLQSPNMKFHRAFAFGEVLAKKIIRELGEKRACEIVSISLQTNSKKRWYEATVEVLTGKKRLLGGQSGGQNFSKREPHLSDSMSGGGSHIQKHRPHLVERAAVRELDIDPERQRWDQVFRKGKNLEKVLKVLECLLRRCLDGGVGPFGNQRDLVRHRRMKPVRRQLGKPDSDRVVNGEVVD